MLVVGELGLDKVVDVAQLQLSLLALLYAHGDHGNVAEGRLHIRICNLSILARSSIVILGDGDDKLPTRMLRPAVLDDFVDGLPLTVLLFVLALATVGVLSR